MKSPGWHWHDQLQDMGYGPEDIEDAPGEPPTSITVQFFAPVEFRDYHTGEIITEIAPCGRVFPMFMEKAAMRFAAYCRRRYGEKSVDVDYD